MKPTETKTAPITHTDAIHHELNEARNAERLARTQLDLARAEVEQLKRFSSRTAIAEHRAARAEAELATEREKVRVLRAALTEIMENSSGWAESTAREALESTECNT